MTLTAMATVGLERKHNLAGFPSNPALFEGSSNETYTQGKLVGLIPAPGSALLTTVLSSLEVKASSVLIAGVAAETKTTTDTNKQVLVDCHPFNVYEGTFSGHYDAVSTKTSSATNAITLSVSTSGSTQQNDAIGSLLYIYEGPGKGDVRTITAHTKGATPLFVVSGAFSQTPTTASKAIVIAGYTSGTKKLVKGVNKGSQLKLASDGKISVEPPAFADGYLNVVSVAPERLTAQVVITPAKTTMLFGNPTS